MPHPVATVAGPAPEALTAALQLYTALAQSVSECCSKAGKGSLDRFVSILQHPQAEVVHAGAQLCQALFVHPACARGLLQVRDT